jgi:hypothetical protein
LHFNRCPLCGKWVCDDCFCAAEIRHGGLCRNCSPSAMPAIDSNSLSEL